LVHRCIFFLLFKVESGLPCTAGRVGVEVIGICWQCKRVFDLFSELHWLTGADSHFEVTRAAECAACDGNGKGKQCHKGKGKE
jgi:hypothetical protein